MQNNFLCDCHTSRVIIRRSSVIGRLFHCGTAHVSSPEYNCSTREAVCDDMHRSGTLYSMGQVISGLLKMWCCPCSEYIADKNIHHRTHDFVCTKPNWLRTWSCSNTFMARFAMRDCRSSTFLGPLETSFFPSLLIRKWMLQ